MYIWEAFKVAIESILSNKLRTFLTMLGIIIGIASVITIVSLGAGGQKAILGEFEKIGVNVFSIKMRNDVDIRESDRLTLRDVENDKKKIAFCKIRCTSSRKNGTC